MTHLILQLPDELLITRQHVRPVLNERAKRPEPQRRFAILLDDIEVWIIHALAHFTDLLYDGV